MSGPKHIELQLTDEMLTRNDEIEHAVYQCILTFAEKDSEKLDCDMAVIGETTEAIKGTLHKFGINMSHPGVVTELKGSQHYSDYDFEEYFPSQRPFLKSLA